ncbi:MAG: ThiF family adenylyltransferase, partial [Candidatus Sericytochromatia bacterium]
SDNLSTRYLLSDACVLQAKPLVHGSVYRFEGQVASFVPGGPCYRCLHPEMPPPGSMPSCAEAGVLGVLPGLVGTLQAAEALRLILGAESGWGTGLSGKLLLADLRTMDFQTLSLPRQPDCPACGGRIRELDPERYPELSCGRDEIGRAQARAQLAAGELLALDVRSAAEHQLGALPGLHIPLAELATCLDTLNPERPLLVYCEKGQRSARAVRLLRQHGFAKTWSLTGGYAAWAAADKEKD